MGGWGEGREKGGPRSLGPIPCSRLSSLVAVGVQGRQVGVVGEGRVCEGQRPLGKLIVAGLGALGHLLGALWDLICANNQVDGLAHRLMGGDVAVQGPDTWGGEGVGSERGEEGSGGLRDLIGANDEVD